MPSKLHKRTRRLVKELLGCQLKEEVNVQKLFPEYPARNHFYDIVIPSYNLIVECHGEQHRNPASFGEKDATQALYRLEMQKHRDRRKEEVVWENGWGYLAIWFDELPKDDDEAKVLLKKKIMEALDRIEDE